MNLSRPSQFYEPGNLADAIMSFQRNSMGALPRKFVDKLKIRTKHLGHKKAVKRIMTQTARQVKFDCPELGGEVTVETYFKKSTPSSSSSTRLRG